MVIGKRDANTKAKLQDMDKYGVERMRDALEINRSNE
jgi:hypothetical protein